MKKALSYRVAVRQRVKPGSRNPPYPNGLQVIPKISPSKNWQPSNPSFCKCLSRKTPSVSKGQRRIPLPTKRNCLGRLAVGGRTGTLAPTLGLFRHGILKKPNERKECSPHTWTFPPQ
jgi:hypothetical protein